MKERWFGPILGLFVLAFLIWITSVDWAPGEIVRQFIPTSTRAPTLTPGPTTTPRPTSTPRPTPTPTYRDWFEQGMANLSAGRYRAAIEDFDEAIRLNPEFSLSYMNRGVAKGRLDRNEEAIQDYSRAIELDPSDACAFRNRGITRARLDQFQEALTDLDFAINLRSQYDEALSNRGWIKLSLKQYQSAIDDFGHAIGMRNNPGSGSKIELCPAEEESEEHVTSTPGLSPTPTPTYGPSPTPSPTSTPTPMPTSGPSPTPKPTSTFTSTPTPTPTSTPNPCPIDCFSDDDARYIRTYMGRGYAYYNLGDYQAAIADLEIARELAQKYGDDRSAESAQELIDAIKKQMASP